MHRGSTLLLCVVLLFALTLLATALAADYRFHSRIQANVALSDAAENRAMAALRAAEDWLRTLGPADRVEPCKEGCTSTHLAWGADALPTDLAVLDLDWWKERTQKVSADAFWLASEIDVPTEHLEGMEWPVTWYRVIALGTDRQQSNQFVAESIFIKPWVEATAIGADPDEKQTLESCRPTNDPPCGRVAWRRLR